MSYAPYLYPAPLSRPTTTPPDFNSLPSSYQAPPVPPRPTSVYSTSFPIPVPHVSSTRRTSSISDLDIDVDDATAPATQIHGSGSFDARQPPVTYHHHPLSASAPVLVTPVPVKPAVIPTIESAPMVSHRSMPSSSSLSSVTNATAPPITYPLPTIDGLLSAAPNLETWVDGDKLAWAEDVLRVLDRTLYPSGPPSDFTSIPSSISDTRYSPALTSLLNQAIPIVISFTTHPDGILGPRASYLKARLLASGACPDFLPRDPRQAFKDFEAAARGGEWRGWFRLGRDYEGVGDLGRAKDCFERGQSKGDCECTYRLGMAYLLGQLRLPVDQLAALNLLRKASDLATIDFPIPAYIYGLLLCSELDLPQPLPPFLVLPPDASPSESLTAQQNLARDALERAAYLAHPPAQYKCGYLYEHAALGCAYDPLMSVQWYALASQGGEREADMALSKWFLCGADGCFAKSEELARTFAEKAARKGHANGAFAMGYYYELGIGGRRDAEQAKKWYQKASRLGNTDAEERLAALSVPVPRLMSMAEHELRLNNTLVRKRTAAKIRSERSPHDPPRLRQQQEALRLQADRAAREAAGETMSPAAARIGEIMSPSPQVFHPAMIPSNSSFPRPPIPHHAFSTGSVALTGESGDGRLGYTLKDAGSGSGSGSGSGPGSGPMTEMEIQIQMQEKRRSRIDEGPQTFAEMGFVSKPVKDKDCRIM